jgi:hypothetical protein
MEVLILIESSILKSISFYSTPTACDGGLTRGGGGLGETTSSLYSNPFDTLSACGEELHCIVF